jgi:antibiotic biosynthesis monooxygenase (ABM) superfamily enzyme
VRSLIETASRSGELEGSSVLSSDQGDYFVLLRFSSEPQLEAWASSPEVLELMRVGDEHSVETDGPVQRSGLETWFTLPGAAMPEAPPPRWKMALITWLALLPQALALSFILPKSWPRIAGVAVGTALPVAVLTWFAMPMLSRLLSGWLYAHARSRAMSSKPRR